MQEKNDHLEFSQNSSIARKLKKHKIAVILGYKENHFKVNTQTSTTAGTIEKPPHNSYHTEGEPVVPSQLTDRI
jgi:hypothetical protein